jgi:hypothetical protein
MYAPHNHDRACMKRCGTKKGMPCNQAGVCSREDCDKRPPQMPADLLLLLLCIANQLS